MSLVAQYNFFLLRSLLILDDIWDPWVLKLLTISVKFFSQPGIRVLQIQ